MSTGERMEGKCLCGAVTVSVRAASDVEACHCGMCRRWGGGPLLSLHGGSDVRISNRDSVSVYASSTWADRAFCRHCGTHLYYLLKPAGQHAVSAGLFQDQPGFELKEQIFIDRKPAYYAFANETVVLTETQVLAKHAPKSS
jgi:hypothetical protein